MATPRCQQYYSVREDSSFLICEHVFSADLCFFFPRQNNVHNSERGWRQNRRQGKRITAVLDVRTNGSKLPPCLILKGKPKALGKTSATNSIEREFADGKDKQGVVSLGCSVCRGREGVALFRDVWVPQVWNRRPGREGRMGHHRHPDKHDASEGRLHRAQDGHVQRRQKSRIRRHFSSLEV